ncbi:putative helicase [Xanthomonas oryzae pv. oryzicola]|nr:putative helicase [Xanthomonas oryzae pv. oryzicola]
MHQATTGGVGGGRHRNSRQRQRSTMAVAHRQAVYARPPV